MSETTRCLRPASRLSAPTLTASGFRAGAGCPGGIPVTARPADRRASGLHGARGREGPSAAISALWHLLIALAVLGLVLPRKVQPPPPPVSFAMVFEAPPDPAPVPIAAAALPAPAAVQVAAPLAASLPRMDIAGTLPRTLPRAHRAPSRPTQAAPVPHDPIPDSKPPAPALARAAQPVPAGNADALAALEARIRQAVADATIYPPAARLLHRQGRSRIRFDYQNGAVSDLAVSRSSEVSSLDEAALSTVRRARMPRPPAEFGDRRLALEVWVNFTLVSDE